MYTIKQLEKRNEFDMKIISQIFPNLKIEFSTFESFDPAMETKWEITDKTYNIHTSTKFDYFSIKNLMENECTQSFVMFSYWYHKLNLFMQNRVHNDLIQYILEKEHDHNISSSDEDTMLELSTNDLLMDYLNWKWENTMKKTESKLTPVAYKTPSEPVKRSVRPSKWEYYMGIAKTVSARSTCLRRQYGAVVVKNDEIIATGYNGAARGEKNCCDVGECWRESHGVPHGEQYEKCVSVHAEANAIISSSRSELMGATMYLYGSENGENCEVEPCLMCNRLIRNSGISVVFCASVDDLSNPVGNPKRKWFG